MEAIKSIKNAVVNKKLAVGVRATQLTDRTPWGKGDAVKFYGFHPSIFSI